MISKKYRQRLVSSLRSQVRQLKSAASALTREFKKMEEAKEFVADIEKLVKLVQEQHTAALEVIARADVLTGSAADNTTEFFKETGSHGSYEFLTAQRQMVEHIGDLDEWRKALAAVSDVMKSVDRKDKKAMEAIAPMTWRLAACQYQIHALARQAEAITGTQEAIFRSYGIKFWQGHKRHLRWVGGGFG